MSIGIVAAFLLAAGLPALKEAEPGLKAQAKVSYQAARKTALARVKGAVIKSAELERENGKLLYSFDLKQKGRSGIDEVQVDAATGEVISVDHEGPAAEAKERAEDLKKK
jgi:uncharacterized membrane protein YkoI